MKDVRKGYGWRHKISAGKEPRLAVVDFVANEKTMHRVAFRYGIEKIDINSKVYS